MKILHHIKCLSILAFIALTSCNKSGIIKNTQELRVDSILMLYHDSAYYNPTKTIDIFSEFQSQFTDSVCIYQLILAKGHCEFFAGNDNASNAINDSVFSFCKRIKASDYIHSATNYKLLEAGCWNRHAIYLQLSNQKDSAIVAYHKAIDITTENSDFKNLINIYINLADTYRQLGKLPESAEYYLKALKTSDSIHELEPIFNIYAGIAQTYADLNNFELANYYFDLALPLYEQKTPPDKYFYCTCRGNCFYSEKRYDASLTWFRKAYDIVNPYKQPLYNALLEINIGEIMILTDHLDSAHLYLNKAQASNALALKDDIRDFYLNSLLAALALKENNLSLADRYLSKTYKTDVSPQYAYLHNKRLKEYYQKKNDFKNAFYYQTKVDLYDDSLRNIKNQLNILEMNSRYKQDTTLLRKDILLADAHHRSSLLQIISISTILLLIIVSVSAYFFIINQKKRNEERYRKQLEELSVLRMENVRNRFSPHSIFNILNAVMPKFRLYEELATPLNLLIQTIRGNLSICEKIAISLEDETNHVKTYALLRSSTNPTTPNVIWNIAPDVDTSIMIPSMILQIPIENALKYAFIKDLKNNENIIEISGSQKNNCLILSISDNGSGYNPGEFAESGKGTGQGLKILFKTITVLNNHNSEKITFHINNRNTLDSNVHGTTVNISIPTTFKYTI